MMVLMNDFSSISLAPFGVAVLILFLWVAWRRTRSFSYLFCLFIFGIYLLLVADKTFFPLDLSDTYRESLQDVRFSSLVNLIPLNFNFSELPNLVLTQIVQNVLLTVPFGFGVNFVAYIPAKRVLWLALAVGLVIEAVQLVLLLLKIAVPLRIVDVNDVLLNALGILIGYGIFRVFTWLYLWVTQRLGIRHWGLSAYVYQIASRAQTI